MARSRFSNDVLGNGGLTSLRLGTPGRGVSPPAQLAEMTATGAVGTLAPVVRLTNASSSVADTPVKKGRLPLCHDPRLRLLHSFQPQFVDLRPRKNSLYPRQLAPRSARFFTVCIYFNILAASVTFSEIWTCKFGRPWTTEGMNELLFWNWG